MNEWLFNKVIELKNVCWKLKKKIFFFKVWFGYKNDILYGQNEFTYKINASYEAFY